MRYGIPYRGSKNSIAKWIIESLPAADVFVDLCFGGGAVTHAALLSGKYKEYIANDIDSRVIPFFIDCCNGKYTTENHPEWVSREDFFKLNDDIYYELIWSFGNNGRQYLCSEEKEPFKKALHYACFYEDTSLLKELGVDPPKVEGKTVYERYTKYKHHFKERLQALENLESLVRLNSLKSLQGLNGINNLQCLNYDYEEAMEIVYRQNKGKNILIYADPPYAETDCRKYPGFDSERFYKWAADQDNIFISEYQMPDYFVPYAWKEKTVLCSSYTNALKKKELIFTNQKTYDKMNDTQKKLIGGNFSEQLTFEDLLK